MKRTAFVCYGSREKGDTLVYQELPRKKLGEEFFVCFLPGSRGHGRFLRSLYRSAISISRLGHPVNYFFSFLETLKSYMGSENLPDEILEDLRLLIMIRRGEDAYILTNRNTETVHWDRAAGAEVPVERMEGQTEIPLRKHLDQTDLFVRSMEDLFELRRFRLSTGEHTLLFLPSRELYEQHREAFRDSIFFPAFRVPAERGIEIDAEGVFPAVHWKYDPAERASSRVFKERRQRWWLSVPAAAGLLTALAMLLILFGPIGRDGEEVESTRALLSAQDEVSSDVGAASGAGDDGTAGDKRSLQEMTLSLSEGWKKRFSKPVTSSPVVSSGTVYFGCRDGSIYALGTDGREMWRFDSGAGIGATPCLEANRLVGANYRGDVFCLDAGTGAKIWEHKAGSKIVSSPAVRDGRVVIATMTGELLSLRLEDGRREWVQKLGTSIWASPTVGKDYIVAATTDGSLVKLDPGGNMIWRVQAGGSILSSPLCADDRNLVVFGTKDKYVFGYALSNGDLMWRQGTEGEVNGSAVRDGDRIYIGSDDGNLYALALEGRLLWKQPLGGKILSRPAVIGSNILVTTYGSRLSAVDSGTGRVVSSYVTSAPVYSSPDHDGDRVFFGSNDGVFYAVNIFGGTG